LQSAGDEMPACARTRRGDRKVVDGPDEAVSSHRDRGAWHEPRLPECRQRRKIIEGQRQQGAPAVEEGRVVLVVRDEGTLPAPRNVAAAVSIRGLGFSNPEIPAEVEQGEVIERRARARGQGGELGPDLRVAGVAGLPDGGQQPRSATAGRVTTQRLKIRPLAD